MSEPIITEKQRRVGRVERWLRKGYGFIIDHGLLQSTENGYGWTRDEQSGNKVFVYHNALQSDDNTVFHRLFANEYVEYTIDPSFKRQDGGHQAFEVTGIAGSKLLCDINAAASAANDNEPPKNARTQRRIQNNTPSPVIPGAGAFPAGSTVVCYVPAGTAMPAPPVMQPQPAVGFPATPTPAAEPSYVMPQSGIPVPK